MTITGTTFTDNRADGYGGAIHNAIISPPGGNLTVTNSSFTGNGAAIGGAISNFNLASISGSTFDGNSASTFDGAIHNNDLVATSATMSMDGTSLTNSAGDNCSGTPVIDNGGNSDDDESCFAPPVPPTVPTVISINRGFASPTNVTNESWTVTFSETVLMVDASDFALMNTGLGGTPTITSVIPTGLGTGALIIASTGSGSGSLGLNLVDNDSIVDGEGNTLGGTGTGNGDFAGQIYTIDRSAPAIEITSPSNNASITTSTTSVSGTASDSSGIASVSVNGTSASYNSVDGTFAASGVTLACGSNTITATATDSAGNTESASIAVTRSCTVATTTSVVSNLNPSTYGQTITFTATVTSGSGNPDNVGTMTFKDGTTMLCSSVSLTGNTATCSTSSLGAGTHGITASYSGSGTFAASMSTALSQSVAKASQTITMTTLAPATANYRTQFTVAATGGGSGNAVTYDGSGVCTNSGSTFTMTSGTGTCNVTYNQAGNANYNAATLVIETVTAQRANQTITLEPIADKTYGDADFDPGASASSGLTATYSASDECTIMSGKAHITATGSCTVTASQVGNDNYSAAADVTRSFSIAKAEPTISISDPSVTYDGQPHAATITAPTTNYSVVYTQGTTVVAAPTNAGTYNVTVEMTDPNYTGSQTGTLTITKANATINVNGYSVTYDGTAYTATGTATGVNNQPLTGLDLTATTHTDAGSYSDRWSFIDSTGNYNAASSTVTNIIAKAALTVTAENKTMTYGDALPTLTYVLSGFIGTETSSVVTGAPTVTTTATSSSETGNYPISVQLSSLAATNYSFTAANGTLMIAKRQATVVHTGDNYVASDTNAVDVRLSAEVLRNGDLGDLSTATVTFTIMTFGGEVQTTATASAATNWSVTVSVPTSDEPYTVEVRIDPDNRYWTSGVDVSPLQAILGYGSGRTTGAGWVQDDANDINGKSTFAFNLQNTKDGITGNSLFIYRVREGSDAVQYVVESNTSQGSGLFFNVNKDAARASFTGRATIQRYVNGVLDSTFTSGYYSFAVDVIDGDLKNPRQSDRYAITVRNSSNTIVKQIGTRSNPLALGGGNVLVRAE